MGQAEKVYDKTAIIYDLRGGNPYTERVRGREAQMIAKHARGRVLDAGCGTGYHLRALGDVVGMDISEEMVKLARKTGKQVRKGDVEKLKQEGQEQIQQLEQNVQGKIDSTAQKVSTKLIENY